MSTQKKKIHLSRQPDLCVRTLDGDWTVKSWHIVAIVDRKDQADAEKITVYEPIRDENYSEGLVRLYLPDIPNLSQSFQENGWDVLT